MLRAISLLSLLACAAASAACPALTLPRGWSEQKLGARAYRVYVPASYTAAAAVPLVVYAHGFTDSSDDFGGSCGERHCNWFAAAESRQLIFVSLVGDLGDASFNAGTCCPPANTLEVDDVGLARSVVGNLSAQLCIDPARVWATGFSNGAMLAQRLACEAADVFVAVASVSGVVELQPGNDEGLARCNASVAKQLARASVLDVHGLKDTVVPWAGDALLGFPQIPNNMAQWASRSGCPAPPAQTWNNGSFYNLRWSGCGPGGKQTVELVTHVGGSHEWPAPTAAFDTTNYVCDWLQSVSA